MLLKYISFDELVSLIKAFSERQVLITFHSIGDRDAVGSAVALSEYLPNSTVATPDFLTGNARRMLESVGYTKKITNKFIDAQAVIVTDADNTEVLGPFREKLLGYSGSVLFIDHHLKDADLSTELPHVDAAYVFSDESYNSTCSIVYAVLEKLGVSVSKEAATLLVNGMIADSADLQNSSPLTFLQLSKLFAISGTSYAKIQEEYHESIPLINRFNTMQDVKAAKLENTGKYILVYGRASEHANVAADTAMNMGADAAVFWSITEHEGTISARLRSPLDVKLNIHLGAYMRSIAKLLNGTGGGHPCAAGAYGTNKENTEIAANIVINKLRQKLQ